MKPEPVQPLHGCILGAQKNGKLPLKPKKVGLGPQLLPLRWCQEPSRHGLPKFTLSGQNKALESDLQVEIQSYFPQRSKSAAAEPAPKEDHQSPHPQQRAEPMVEVYTSSSCTTLCLIHLGEPKLPYGCSSKSLTILTQMGGIFPDLQPQGKGPSRAKMLCGWSESVPGPLCPLHSRRDIVLVQPIRNTNHWHQNLTLECRLNQKRLCSTKKTKQNTTHNNKNNTQKNPFCSGLSCIFLHLLI